MKLSIGLLVPLALALALATLRSRPATTLIETPVRVSLRLRRRVLEQAMVPNLLGVLEGLGQHQQRRRRQCVGPGRAAGTGRADRWPEERIFFRSDHYHFVRRGVPILFFTSGTHPDYHQPGDAAERVDAEKASRVVRLLQYLTTAIADDPVRPRWSAEWRRDIVRQD